MENIIADAPVAAEPQTANIASDVINTTPSEIPAVEAPSFQLPESFSPEQISQIYTKLGKPETAEGYELKDGDPNLIKAASSWMHEAGLSKDQAHALTAKWNEFSQSQQESLSQQYEVDANNAVATLKGEYGSRFDEAKDLAARAMRYIAPDLDENNQSQTMDKIQQAIGAEAYFKMFAKLGTEFFSEHKFAGLNNGDIPPMTSDQAQLELDKLKKDADFRTKFKNGDTASQEKWSKLIKAAAGKQ